MRFKKKIPKPYSKKALVTYTYQHALEHAKSEKRVPVDSSYRMVCQLIAELRHCVTADSRVKALCDS